MDSARGDHTARARLHAELQLIEPVDATERTHVDRIRTWIDSGSPLWRIRKPDVPPMHLVAYLVVVDPAGTRLLLGDHLLSGLRLPAGGHVEPGEDPWECARRECDEELRVAATPDPVVGPHPLFVTVTETKEQGRHTDVSLWYVVRAAPEDVFFDDREFSAVSWLTPAEVLQTPLDTLDPNMHRFTRKFLKVVSGSSA